MGLGNPGGSWVRVRVSVGVPAPKPALVMQVYGLPVGSTQQRLIIVLQSPR